MPAKSPSSPPKKHKKSLIPNSSYLMIGTNVLSLNLNVIVRKSSELKKQKVENIWKCSWKLILLFAEVGVDSILQNFVAVSYEVARCQTVASFLNLPSVIVQNVLKLQSALPWRNVANVHCFISNVIERNATTAFVSDITKTFNFAILFRVMIEILQVSFVFEETLAISRW
jgi:hypothetical protein